VGKDELGLKLAVKRGGESREGTGGKRGKRERVSKKAEGKGSRARELHREERRKGMGNLMGEKETAKGIQKIIEI